MMQILGALPMDCWIRTSRERKNTFHHTWRINDYSKISLNSGEWLKSEPFQSGDKKDQCKWQLKLAFDESNSPDCFGIECVPSKVALYQQSIVDCNGELQETESGYLQGIDTRWNFMKREQIVDDEYLVPFDIFTIHCKITECGDFSTELWERDTFCGDTVSNDAFELLVKDLGNLYEDKRSSDAVLKFQSIPEEFPCHKGIVMARSLTFKCLFESSDNLDTGLVIPEEIFGEMKEDTLKVNLVKIILRFIYSNSHEDVSKDNWKEVYRAAKYLELEQLQRICVNVAINCIDLGNYLDILKLATKCHDYDILQEACFFIKDNLVEISRKRECKEEQNALCPDFVMNKEASSEEFCATLTFKKFVIWSIENYSKYPLLWQESPAFKMTTKESLKCSIILIYEDDVLCFQLRVLDTSDCTGKIQYLFSIVNSKGKLIHTTSSFQHDLLNRTYDKVECFSSDSWNAIKTDMPDDTLIIHCSFTVLLNHKKRACSRDALSNSFIDDMRSLYKDEGSQEIILKTNDLDIIAHKYMMCARSNIDNVIDNVGDMSTLKAMVFYIYTGCVGDVSVDKASSLLKVANMYGVHGLKDICEQYLSSCVSMNNVFELLELSNETNNVKLKSSVRKFALFHFREIVSRWLPDKKLELLIETLS